MLRHLNTPFSNRVLENKASALLGRYARQRNWRPSLPVPVDKIVEQTLDLSILYEQIDEPERVTIWGCITPGKRRITLNEAHMGAFSACPGLERFTLAHEAGHWVMHVNQAVVGQRDLFGSTQEAIVCRAGDTSPSEQTANRFAAFLLMPRDLMWALLSAGRPSGQGALRAFADEVGVSMEALEYRLKHLRQLGAEV